MQSIHIEKDYIKGDNNEMFPIYKINMEKANVVLYGGQSLLKAKEDFLRKMSDLWDKEMVRIHAEIKETTDND